MSPPPSRPATVRDSRRWAKPRPAANRSSGRRTVAARRLLVQGLEPRHLLSTLPIGPSQRDRLIGHLDDLGQYAQSVEASEPLNRSLPMVGQSFASRFDLSDVVRDRFAEPLSQYLAGEGSSASPTDVSAYLRSDAVVGRFDGLEFSVGPTTGTVQDNELVFDTTMYAFRSVDYTFDIAAAGRDLGLRLPDLADSQRTVEFGMTLDFEFGVDAAGEFFASIETFRVEAVDALQIVAEGPAPAAASLTEPITFDLRVNEGINLAVTLPAVTPGNVTPLSQRLTAALAGPLREAGLDGAIVAVDRGGHLAFRAVSADIRHLQLGDGDGLATLGFTPSATVASEFSPTVVYGLLDLDTESAGVVIDGRLDFVTDSGGDGRLSPTELLGAPPTQLVARGGARAVLHVSPGIDGVAVPDQPSVRFSNDVLFAPSPVVATPVAFAPIDGLHDDVTRTLREGFRSVTQFGTRLESETSFSNPIAGFSSSLGDVVDFDAVLREQLQRPIDELLDRSTRPSWEDVRDALESVPGVSMSDATSSRESMRLDIDLESDASVALPVDLGDAVIDAGLVVTSDALSELTLATMLTASLGIEIDRRRTASPMEAFAVRFDSIEASAVAAGSIDFDTRVGLLGLAANGSADLDATLAATIGGGQAIAAGTLNEWSMSELVSTTSGGSFVFDVPLSATIGSQSFSASLALPPGDPFGGTLQVQPVGFASFQDFLRFGPGDVTGGLEQIGEWFADFSAERLGDDVPFASATRVGDAIDLSGAFGSQIAERLRESDGSLTFATVQSLAALLPGITSVDFDPGSHQLVFDLEFDDAMRFPQSDGTTSEEFTAALGFDVNLGELVGLSSDADVGLRADVESRFRVGIDLRPLGHAAAAITPATPLEGLNAGRGVMIDAGDDVEVELRSGETFRVSFDGAVTVGDVIARMHAARDAAQIPASRFGVALREENGKGVGLRMTDDSPDRGVAFRIRGVEGSLAGLGLGIVGEDRDGDGVIDGMPLHGDTFADHLFIEPIGEEPIARGRIELSNDNFQAGGNLGFLSVEIDGGRFIETAGEPSHVTAAVELIDAATGAAVERISLANLFRSLDGESGSVSARASLDGQIGLKLPVRSMVGASEFGGTVNVSLCGFGDEMTSSIGPTFGGDWTDLVRVDAAGILDGLRDGLARLLDLDSESAFAAGLPIVNARLPSFLDLDGLLSQITSTLDSIGSSSLLAIGEELRRFVGEPVELPEIDVALPDLVALTRSVQGLLDSGDEGEGFALPDLEPLFLEHFGAAASFPDVELDANALGGFASGLLTRIADLQRSGAGSLQQLEGLLESALGISAESLALSLDTSQAGTMTIRVDLSLDRSVSESLPLELDLRELGLAGIGDLIDVSGSSAISLAAGAAVTLSLGLDVSGSGVQPFLYGFDPVTRRGTHVALTAGAVADEIEFDASLGPIGVAVVGGSAGINRTGVAGDSDPAGYLITLADDASGRVVLDDSMAFQTAASGGAFASLPLEIPRGNPITTIEFSTADLMAGPDGSSLNVAEVTAAIEDRIAAIRDAGIGSNLLAMVGGWEGAFDLLIDTMRGDVLGVSLPLIGDALADEADFLEDIKRSVVSNIAGVADQGVTLVQRGIFDALGPGGLNLLQDATGDGSLTPDDVQFTYDSVTNRVDFDLHLRKAVEAVELPIRFDLGLPGLNLDVDAPVQLSFGADFRLGFGVSLDEGFFFATDPSRTQLELFFDAEVPQLSAAGQLAFLDIIASTIPGSPTRFDGSFVVNVSDDVVGDGNGLLAFDEMVGGDFADVIDHTLSARADVDLNLVVSMGDSSLVPRMRTDLIVDWEFIAGQGLNAPEVRFENVQLNLGDFFGGFVGEVLGEVQDTLRPVQPMIDLLTARLPVISDLSGSRVTLVDLARLFGRADVANFAQSVIDVNNLVTGLPQVGPDSWIDMGAFGVAADALGGFSGPGSASGGSSSGGSGPRGAVSMIDVQVESDPLGQAAARGGSRGGTWTNNLTNARGSLSFPLLQNPMTAFQLLLGRDVDLFLYDAPALGIDFTYSQFFPIPAMPILGAEIAGRLVAVADFAFGFDTTGIRKFQQSRSFVDIFDGFFVSDRVNPDGTGRDVSEAYLRGSLTAAAKLELLIAEAGVRGGIFAGVDFDLHDNDRDGRVRGGELAENFALGPIHIFDVSGRVDASLVAFVDVNLLLFTLHEEYEIARANLLNFEIQRPTGGVSPTEILTSRAGDVLTIRFTEQNDNYRVFPGSVPNSIVVQGQGMQTVDLIGIEEIRGSALGGDDMVTISPEVMIPVWIDGGEGNDQLTAGGGRAVLRGGAGNDVLVGGIGDDHLIGGPGDDRLFGAEGNDLLEGIDGEDLLDGGRGDDVILGGADDDVLRGGLGNDTIEGGEGHDIIDGGRGDDLLRGGSGDDQISGGRGDDLIEGGPGNDVLLGESGNDRIDGGEGEDVIEGGEGEDVLFGDAGDDIIDGGTGNDRIDGGDGDDEIRGGGGIDTIFGGGGHDVIYADEDQTGNPEAAPSFIDGGGGDDLIYGSRGDDQIFGGPGNDTVFALVGNDWIEGGDGNDTIDAGSGDDVVVGGRGDDTIDGGAGSDLLWGGSLVHDPEHFNLSDPSLFELPPRFEEAVAFGGSGYVPPLLITPKVVAGLSIDGSVDDGDDVIRGGAGNDSIFGGGGDDSLFGGSGHDYIDGGAGQDALFGGDGDDVLRGGNGNDVLHGGAGIDQLYGDQGDDTLYGDAGTAGGSSDGQRLFGGVGDDRLFAWAAGNTSDLGAMGDELWGGVGQDFLYGNGRNDLLVGEAGNDLLHGDWAHGPDYARNPFAAFNFDLSGNPVGSDDRLFGGLGNDQLFGGGGDDELAGGPGDDWLEGQDGRDTLLGGGGIDFQILDIDPRYHVVGGGRTDGHGDGSPDDHATDILLINGTAGDDVIRLRTSVAGESIRRHDGEIIGAAVGGQLMVEYNQARIEAVWSEFGIPLIDQFRISGLGGDDLIEFVRGEQALDLTPLIDRSRDFVSVIDGGPGNDTLLGTPGRDRIDGGRGSDVIFGFEGDDRLWGDQGANDGSVTDHDVIFAGSGNDDVLGGQGTNDLFAWSLDPRVGSLFGVYRGSDGNLYQEIDEGLAAAGITFELENTGLNRIIGSSRDDRLYGGTGVDLLYGNGGDDQLFTRDGTPFENLDGQQAGDEWKAYARSSEQVWYVGGTNTDDVISVDFVTEPGVLQGHHLVTRLTDNNGSFSFDAQVRLDFSATDGDGNLIWDPNDLLADMDGLQSDNPFTRAEALDRRFSDAVRLSRFLPSEGDFQVILIDALAGDDVITVGPTVQKTVWIDAGAGDDTVRIESGRAILIDQTDPVGNRNDSVETAFPLVGPAVLIGTAEAPGDGVLNADARFRLIVDDLDQHVVVDIPAALTDGTATGTQANTSLDDLVDDINGVLSRSAAVGRVTASRNGDRIALSTTKVGPETRLAITIAAGDPAITELGLSANDSAEPSSKLLRSTTFRGLTIDNPTDVDHYRFELLPAALAGDNARVTVGSISAGDGMELALFAVGESEPIVDGIDATVGIDLQASGVQAGRAYVLRVRSDAIPTIYDVRFDFGDGVTSVGVDLAAIRDFPRRDVIFGGPGNDVLQGGPGEDFIFAGPGNDVLTGGEDAGASDLLFGGPGDDTFQTVPGELPKLLNGSQTFLPTFSDRFDGGVGNDRVLFLGGDLDDQLRPINDHVALRFNRLLQRYEVSALRWDTANRRFVPAADDPSGASFERGWHFYTTVDVERTEFDLGAGDDEFRADGGYVFPGDLSGQAWGILEGDRQAGGGLTQLIVDGGPGNDRLYGGAYDDRLIGGLGNDFLAGGLGNDELDGGEGDDILAGQTTIEPDPFEFVTRSFGTAGNETFSFAAELPPLWAGATVRASFHDGDRQDWYVLRPQAGHRFASESLALIDASMIRVYELTTDGEGNLVRTGVELGKQLFPTVATGTAEESLYEPQTFAAGAPEALLLLIENRMPQDVVTRLTARHYEIEFSDELSDVINADVRRLVGGRSGGGQPPAGFSRKPTDLGIGASGKGVVIPAGDFDGDGYQDYILSLREQVPGSGFGPDNFAYLYYGGEGILDPSMSDLADQPVTEILLSDGIIDSGDGNSASIGPAGDVDGDGSDDLIVSIENQEGSGAFYILFGGTDRPGFLSPFDSAELRTVWVDGVSAPDRFHRRVNARPVGDLTGDGRDEIAVVDGDGTYVFAGRSRAEWTAETLGRSDADAMYPFEAYRAAGLGDFDGDGIPDFGTVSEGTLRIFFGAADGSLGNLESVTVSGNFTTSDLLASGPLFSPGIASAVISGKPVLVGTDTPWGSDTSYLVESRGRLAPRLVETSELLLRPVGDLTGDGLDELASPGRKEIALDGDFPESPSPPARLRWVTHLYISDDAADREARLTSVAPRPHVVLDFADAPFSSESRFLPGTFAPIFASVGDVGSGQADSTPDGRDDFLVVTPERTSFSVIYGTDWVVNELASFDLNLQPARIAESRLALPLPEASGGMGIDLLAGGVASLRDAISIEGAITGDSLRSVRSIGDINGDEHEDFLLSGENVDYFVYGPFEESARLAADDVSVLALANGGRPVAFSRGGVVASGAGDLVQKDLRFPQTVGALGPDGINDLVVMIQFCTGDSCNRHDLWFINGGEDFHQNLTNDAVVRASFNTPHRREELRLRLTDWNATGGDEFIINNERPGTGTIAWIRSFDTGALTTTLQVDRGTVASRAGYSTNGDARFVTMPIGDINGDGLTDLAIASADLYRPLVSASENVPNFGATFIILGGSSGVVTLGDADHVLHGDALGQDVVALGDLDEDGYDDFAITRSLEGSGSLAGGIEIFRGGVWANVPGTPIEPSLRIARDGADRLPSSLAYRGPMYVAAGDVDGDGRSDLVVGHPQYATVFVGSGSVLQDNFADHASVFFDVESMLGQPDGTLNVLSLGDPDFAVRGSTLSESAGTLTSGRLADFNGDGLDDIWIGSENFNGLIGQFKAGAGRVHFIPGMQRSVSLPADGDFEVLVNRGDRLVDPQTGQPVVFVPPALRAGEQDRWFRFATAGDGQAGNQVRVTSLSGPDVPEPPIDELPQPTVRIDLISDDGRVLATNQTIIDFRNRAADSYWIRVHRDLSLSTTVELPFQLEIDPPVLGSSHRPSDRDRLFGGPGDDRLSGGAELDVLRGGSGSDLFLSEQEERFDFENGIDQTDPAFNRPEEANHRRLGQPSETRIEIAANFDRALWRPIAEALGHPVTTDSDSQPVLHRPWFASELAQIETLDLAGVAAPDLSGLELMPNLRHLDLRSSSRTSIDLPVLPKLEQLILSGNPIEQVSASELSGLPQLETLVLDNTSVADLGGLVGVRIVDDRDGGYTEAGDWQSEASAAADAWLDDYRFTKSGGSATWTVAVPVGEIIRLWATWPTLDNESTTETAYQVFDGESLMATVPVFQTTPAGASDDDVMFGGRPWEDLGEFASSTGELRIELSGVDGAVVAADAIRAEQVSSPALSLTTISLFGSPLNDVSRDELLGRLQENHPDLNVFVTPNENAPSIAPIANQTVRHGSLSFHDDVAVLPNQVLNGLGSFMVDFWFRADSIQNSTLFSASEGAGAINEFFIALMDGGRVRIADQNGLFDFNVSINLDDSQWHHYAVIRDAPAGRLRLFVDGSYVGERAIPTPVPPVMVAAGGLLLGQEQDAVGGAFQTSQAAYGQLDDLRVWDRFWDHSLPAGEFALQAKRVREIRDQSVSSLASHLRAFYRFDEAEGSVVVDSGANGWNGTLGNGLDEGDPARRSAPARANGGPVRQSVRIDVATELGDRFDLDGERVTFTAISDHPAVEPRVSGSTLFLDYDSNLSTTARITVTATDENGRQARTSFDLNIDGVLRTPGEKGTSTVLTFNGGFANSAVINANYGDRVTSAAQGAFSYGSGVRGPSTPNVVADYLPVGAVRFWQADYGNLTNVVYRQSGATDPLEIVLTADAGYRVALHGFDLAGWDRTNRPITFLEVLDEAGRELYRRDGITVLGTGGTHSSFDFGAPLTGQTVRIRIDPGASRDNIGIDNVRFSQFVPSVDNRRFTDGSVYLDTNQNGERDVDERGIGGIVVHLLDASGEVLLCTVTDTDGRYRLDGGPAAEEFLVETVLPNRWRATSDASVVVSDLESTIDFGVAKPLDIGADRSGVEGAIQSFEMATELTLDEIAWEVRQGADVIETGAAESFTFAPPNEGSYRVSVTARDAASGVLHDDELWLRVRNAPPRPVILVDGASASEMTVDEGSVLTLTASVTDPGPSDVIESFRWSATTASGHLADETGGDLHGDPVPAWTFDADVAGSYEIRLQVWDDAGAVGVSGPLSIQVRGVAPSIELTESAERTNDGMVRVAGSLVDSGDGARLGEADFGDGTRRPVVLRADGSFVAEHRYEDPGRYRVKVRIADANGEFDERSFDVDYDPFAPTSIVTYGSINENVDTTGGPVFVSSLVAEDETPDDSHRFELVAGDGDADNESFAIEGNRLLLRQGIDVDYEAQGRYTVRVRVTDAVGQSHEESLTVGVNDLIELGKDAITIDDGSSQRSRVTSVVIRFDESVTFTGEAFRVMRRGVPGDFLPIDVTSRPHAEGGTLVEIGFGEGESPWIDAWGSLADGGYELQIAADQVFNGQGFGIDAAGDGRTDGTFRFGDEAADNFFRLFGDSTGDRIVNSADFRLFRASYLRAPDDDFFEAGFDFNGDGFINSADFRQFRQQYLKGIPHAND